MTILARLTRAKKSRRETWDDLSLAVGQNSRQAFMSKLSKRTLEEDLQMIKRLAKALGVSPAWLAFGIGRKDAMR